MKKSNPVARVEKMFDLLTSKLIREPKLILCVLPEKKNCDIYGMSLGKIFQAFHLHRIFIIHLIFFCQILGPWKKKCLSEFGVVTQCISPLKITDQYLTNVLLKINSKVNDYFITMIYVKT